MGKSNPWYQKMSNEMKKVKFACNTCKTMHEMEIASNLVDNFQAEGILSVAIRPPCGHSCHVFFDQDLKVRGGQCADVELTPDQFRILGKATPAMGVESVRDKLLIITFGIMKVNLENRRIIKENAIESLVEEAEFFIMNGNLEPAIEKLSRIVAILEERLEPELAKVFLDQVRSLDSIIEENPNIDWVAFPIKKNGAEKSPALADRIKIVLYDLEKSKDAGEVNAESFQFKKYKLDMLLNKFR